MVADVRMMMLLLSHITKRRLLCNCSSSDDMATAAFLVANVGERI